MAWVEAEGAPLNLQKEEEEESLEPLQQEVLQVEEVLLEPLPTEVVEEVLMNLQKEEVQ